MKDYYETQKKRYELILNAFDDRAAVMLKHAADNTFDIEKVKACAEELCETRKLITAKIKYLVVKLDKLKEEGTK